MANKRKGKEETPVCTSRIPLGKQFYEHLIDLDHTKDSARDYIYYISYLNDRLFNKLSPEGNRSILNEDEYLKVPFNKWENVLNHYLVKIYSDVSEYNQNNELRNIGKWRSAFQLYYVFLFDNNYAKKEFKKERKRKGIEEDCAINVDHYISSQDLVANIYTLKMLRKNFVFRLTTQNRLKNKGEDLKVLLPLSLIRSIYAWEKRKSNIKDKRPNPLDEWATECVDEILLEIEAKKGTVPFKKVKALKFTPDGVKAVIGMKEYSVLSPSANNDDCKKMRASLLSKIHIDHVIPIDCILKYKSDEKDMEGLALLTNIIYRLKINVSNKTKGQIKKLCEELYKDELIELLPKIEKSLYYIKDIQRLKLMDGKENSSKKNHITDECKAICEMFKHGQPCLTKKNN